MIVGVSFLLTLLAAFNTALDFMLVGLAAFEIWQFLFRAHAQHLTSILEKFKALEPHVRRQRLSQTVLVCLPLSLSGVACIIKSPVRRLNSRKEVVADEISAACRGHR